MPQLHSILLVFALPQEAKPFVQYTQAKLLTEVGNLKYYESPKYNILITGLGNTAAATAIGWYFGKYNTKSIVWNIGTAASAKKEVHSWQRIVQVYSQSTEQYFYPEIQTSHFPLATCCTVTKPHNEIMLLGIQQDLVDMEFFALAKAAQQFVPTNFIQSIKWVSDNGSLDFYKNKNWQTIYAEKLKEVLIEIDTQSVKIIESANKYHADIAPYLQLVESKLQISFTQKVQLKNALIHAVHTKGNQWLSAVLDTVPDDITQTHLRNTIFTDLLNQLYE
jgi:nucleoside phosphorylase